LGFGVRCRGRSSVLDGLHDREPLVKDTTVVSRSSGFQSRRLKTKAPLETGLSLTGLATEVCFGTSFSTGSAQPVV
jgi:hypothetical protein